MSLTVAHTRRGRLLCMRCGGRHAGEPVRAPHRVEQHDVCDGCRRHIACPENLLLAVLWDARRSLCGQEVLAQATPHARRLHGMGWIQLGRVLVRMVEDGEVGRRIERDGRSGEFALAVLTPGDLGVVA